MVGIVALPAHIANIARIMKQTKLFRLPPHSGNRRELLESIIDGIERCVLTLVYLSFK